MPGRGRGGGWGGWAGDAGGPIEIENHVIDQVLMFMEPYDRAHGETYV